MFLVIYILKATELFRACNRYNILCKLASDRLCKCTDPILCPLSGGDEHTHWHPISEQMHGHTQPGVPYCDGTLEPIEATITTVAATTNRHVTVIIKRYIFLNIESFISSLVSI